MQTVRSRGISCVRAIGGWQVLLSTMIEAAQAADELQQPLPA
jgi:hypothetical protein